MSPGWRDVTRAVGAAILVAAVWSAGRWGRTAAGAIIVVMLLTPDPNGKTVAERALGEITEALK